MLPARPSRLFFPLGGTSVPAGDSNDGQTQRQPKAHDADALNESRYP
jgi:hypothetical protein